MDGERGFLLSGRFARTSIKELGLTTVPWFFKGTLLPKENNDWWSPYAFTIDIDLKCLEVIGKDILKASTTRC